LLRHFRLRFDLQVGVHIADVSHFIRPGTAIDKEAARRGTTVYLIDKVDTLIYKKDTFTFLLRPMKARVTWGHV